jgi:hydrogenase-4 component F
MTAVLVCLVTLAFLGLSIATTRILFQPQPDDATEAAPALTRGEPSQWMVTPVVAGVLVLLVLGLAPPPDLVDLLNTGARELLAGAP